MPDILALNKDRLLIEIEIKISISDFRRDQAKRKWLLKRRSLDRYPPAYFYFLVPKELVEKVKGELPPGAGLLTVSEGWRRNPRIMNPSTHLPDIASVVNARRDPRATKLPIRDVIELVRHQTGTLCSMAADEAFREAQPWPTA